jgi:MFS family permease
MVHLQAISPARTPLECAVSRAYRRLALFLMLAYIVAFLDRANLGYAKQALHTSVGISEAMYALGAGLFFLSYSLCGFPSNLILHRIGARTWMSILMLSWGLASMAMMFVHGPASFYVLRILCGMAEAGFFPGCVLYLTYWFPNRIRGEILGFFYLGVPLALVLGGPLSGFLLELPARTGLQGWQWMFLVEGALAVGMGLFSFSILDSHPADAGWLPDDEKHALIEALAREEQERSATGPAALGAMLRDTRVLFFLLIYFMIQMGVYAAVFYLPSQVSALINRPQGLAVGAVTAIPWLCATAASYWLPKWGDRWGSHRTLAALSLFAVGAAGFAFPLCGLVGGLLALCVAASGLIAVQPLFWTLPTGYLAGRARAGGIALIGAGNLGGLAAPPLKLWAEQSFHSARAGLFLLAGITVFNALLIALVRPRAQREMRTKV